MPGQHAILSPSSASRWLACTPSARLEAEFPNKSSAAADEGTLAHAIAETRLKYLIGIEQATHVREGEIILDLYNAQMYEHSQHPLFDESMIGHIDEYANYVMELYAEAKKQTSDAVIYLEKKLNLTDYVPDGFGTGDVGIVADDTLHVVDLKYGKGLKITAINNKQMMLYGLGWLREFDHLYDIRELSLTIYQPRIDNYSTWTILVSDLRAWADNELLPKAKQAFAGEGDFAPGDHCRFCRAKAQCKALAAYNLDVAKHDFKSAVLLTDEEISEILAKADGLVQWVKSVEDFALEQAVSHGKQWPGYKLVEGKSNRVYGNEAEVVEALLTNGYSEDTIYNKKLKGIGEMEKLLSKPVFSIVLGPHLIKPTGKPTLTTVDDKRPAIKSVDSAVKDFS